jgi:mono/diheme cytochrome c family protein
VGAAAGAFAVAAQATIASHAQAPADAMSVSAGVYTDEQAKRGEVVSNKLCTSCHGPDLSGGEAGPTLVGLEFLGNWNSLSIADFFDRVHSTMPADAPGTMTPRETSDVTAYVLKLNKFPAGQTELPTDVALLKNIKIEGQPPAQ